MTPIFTLKSKVFKKINWLMVNTSTAKSIIPRTRMTVGEVIDPVKWLTRAETFEWMEN